MPRIYCAHCHGQVRGTADNPQFSIVETSYYGNPVVEVLKNGGPIHTHDTHFRFGRRKVEMLLAAMPALYDFRWGSDEERLQFQPRTIRDQQRALEVRIYVQMYPDFEYSTGAIIDRPWLNLQALPPDNIHLGLGVMKCWAIWSVRGALHRWVQEQANYRPHATPIEVDDREFHV
jgi:hypothetical protein